MADKPKRADKRITLAPLSFEEALKRLLETEPPSKADASQDSANVGTTIDPQAEPSEEPLGKDKTKGRT